MVDAPRRLSLVSAPVRLAPALCWGSGCLSGPALGLVNGAQGDLILVGPVPGLRSADGTGRTGRFYWSWPGSAVRAASDGNLHHGRDNPVRSANLMGLDRHDGRSSCRSREPVAECHVGKVCRVHAGKCLFGHPEGLQRAVDDEPVVTGLCAEPSVPVDPVRVCGESREGDQGELVHVNAVRYRGLEGGFDEVLGRSGPISWCRTRCGTRSRG